MAFWNELPPSFHYFIHLSFITLSSSQSFFQELVSNIDNNREKERFKIRKTYCNALKIFSLKLLLLLDER